MIVRCTKQLVEGRLIRVNYSEIAYIVLQSAEILRANLMLHFRDDLMLN